MRRRTLGTAITCVALAVIGAATLAPTSNARPVVGSALCILCGDYGGVDFLLNVILFVPLGLGLRLAGAPVVAAVIGALAATTTIETLQLQVIAGRDASLGDLVSNTLGGLLGALLVGRWRALLFPPARRAARLALLASAAWFGLAAVTALSTTLWTPHSEVLYRRSPAGRRWGWFPGRILGTSAGDAAIARAAGDGDGRFAVPAPVPQGGPVLMTVVVVSGGPAPGSAAISMVMDPDGHDVVSVLQRRRDLVFRVRTGAALALLRVPGLTVENLFAPRDERAARAGWPVAGDTVRVAAHYTRQRLRLDVWWRGGHAVRAAPLHPFVAWSYLLPWEYSYGRWAGVLSALWAGGLIAPAAYWAARARAREDSRPSTLAVGLAAGGGLLLVPMVAGVNAVPAVVWGGVALGLAFGVGAGRWSLGADRGAGAGGAGPH